VGGVPLPAGVAFAPAALDGFGFTAALTVAGWAGAGEGVLDLRVAMMTPVRKRYKQFIPFRVNRATATGVTNLGDNRELMSHSFGD